MFSLFNYIGVKGYHTNPDSGRFINQLPGISLRNIQRTANSEQVTFLSVWEDVQNRAWTRLTTDLRTKLRAKYHIKSNRGLMHIVSSTSTENIAAAGKYRGVVIDSGIDNNGFFAYYVTAVRFTLLQDVASVPVKIYGLHGELLDSFTISNATAGVNVLNVNRSYTTPFLFISVDAATVALPSTTLVIEYVNKSCELLCTLLGDLCEPSVYGAEADKTTPSIVDKTNYSYGITADVMATCDYSSIVGYQKELFIGAWMYLLGAELMMERMFSDRKNELTTVDADQAEALRDHYTGEYENALTDVINGIQINEHDACIECRKPSKWVERMP
jgi:hypothetical protein